MKSKWSELSTYVVLVPVNNATNNVIEQGYMKYLHNTATVGKTLFWGDSLVKLYWEPQRPTTIIISWQLFKYAQYITNFPFKKK